jgi:hypothetical protein
MNKDAASNLHFSYNINVMQTMQKMGNLSTAHFVSASDHHLLKPDGTLLLLH